MGLFVSVDSMTGMHTPKLSEPIIDGILRRGHMMMLTGPPKAGKSWSMAQLAYAVATGSEWLGFKCHEGRVAYIDTELDPNSLYNRFDQVRSAMNLMDSHGHLKAWSMRGTDADAQTVADELEKAYSEPPDLVILDSIYSLESGDENNAGDMRKMFKQLARITSWGSSVTFAHHHAKGNAGLKNVIDRGSGSGVFGRFVDTMIDLTPTELDEDQMARLADTYSDKAVAMRMSFVLREFADPGNRNVVFDFPLLRMTDGEWLSDAPEQGTREAGLVKARKEKSKKDAKKWGALDEAIGRAVNQCTHDKVPPTRDNVAERLVWHEDVTREKLKRWTSGDSGTLWRARRERGEWVLYCTDETWFA